MYSIFIMYALEESIHLHMLPCDPATPSMLLPPSPGTSAAPPPPAPSPPLRSSTAATAAAAARGACSAGVRPRPCRSLAPSTPPLPTPLAVSPCHSHAAGCAAFLVITTTFSRFEYLTPWGGKNPVIHKSGVHANTGCKQQSPVIIHTGRIKACARNLQGFPPFKPQESTLSNESPGARFFPPTK